MKKIITIFLILLLSINLVACKVDNKVGLETIDNIIYCTDENVSDDVAKALGKEKKELSASMKEAGIIFYGIALDKTFTVSVIKETTDFSKKVVDFGLFSDSQLDEIAKEISPSYSGYHKNDTNIYIVQDTVSYGTQNSLPARQYITVKEGNFYIITFTFSDTEFKDQVYSVADNIVDEIKLNSWQDNISFYSIIIIVLILAVISLIVYVVTSLIKDLIKAKKDKKSAEN